MGECILNKARMMVNNDIYSATTRNASIDLGILNLIRYLDTSGVPNSNSGTYTASSRSASLDMGSTNSYRYVNTNSVPNSNSGTYSASSRSSSLDMGSTNSYRYVNTNGVPTKALNVSVLLADKAWSGTYTTTRYYDFICATGTATNNDGSGMTKTIRGLANYADGSCPGDDGCIAWAWGKNVASGTNITFSSNHSWAYHTRCIIGVWT